MRPELPRAGVLSLREQLVVLPPAAKVVAGLAMLGMGVGAMLMLPGSFYSIVLICFGTALGVPLVLAGRAEFRQRRRDADEMVRARADLETLKPLVTEAVREKRGVDRLLRERGYSSEKVRRWIALECDVVLPRRDV
ncbi:MAG TPA: hypothetical protein VFZ65_11900 [Planctomycetota bacterium]|nr:hypothetical protein [Planctomycetota bacterium]